MASTITYVGNAAAQGAVPQRARNAAAGATAIYLAIGIALALAWIGVRMSGLRAGSLAGYWLGVAGGIFMLLLFAYPLRKRVRFMARWGAAKWWFAVHMVLGIGGPLLVLVHSTFRVGSLNAAVALYSMLIVGVSGVVGRFLYLQVHMGLTGERRSLAHLQHVLGLQHDSVHSAMGTMRQVEDELLAFEHDALAGPPTLRRHVDAFVLLPIRARWAYTRSARNLRQELRRRAREMHWDRRAARKEYRRLKHTMEDYLQAVVRTAQFQGAVRLFSLWHVLHVPFVYVMVLCAIAHVLAVHAY